ncbi:MAG: hypothetical protein ACOYMB_00470 [Patescibacteria group bacterium]
MKKKSIVFGALAMLTLVAVAGASLPVLAATDSSATANASSRVNKLKNRLDNFKRGKTLTAAQKVDNQSKMEARKAEMVTERADMQTALNSGSFDTWVLAVKKYKGDNAPILKQVTRDNFAKFVEAQGYLVKGKTMMEEMGVKGGISGMHK